MKANWEATQVRVKVYKADVTTPALEFYVAEFNDVELKRQVKKALAKCGMWQYATYVWQGKAEYLYDEAGIASLSTI